MPVGFFHLYDSMISKWVELVHLATSIQFSSHVYYVTLPLWCRHTTQKRAHETDVVWSCYIRLGLFVFIQLLWTVISGI
ncbi:hypothetical protein EDC04DRAFT_143544 [Pisolithus marmoratus]|nr:hypothetical protein EDC04DRAFT_143544 [Pisolithus marmoratus]